MKLMDSPLTVRLSNMQAANPVVSAAIKSDLVSEFKAVSPECHGCEYAQMKHSPCVTQAATDFSIVCAAKSDDHCRLTMTMKVMKRRSVSNAGEFRTSGRGYDMMIFDELVDELINNTPSPVTNKDLPASTTDAW